MSNEILIEIAYALPQVQTVIPLKVAEGITAEQAIHASGILEQFPEIDLSKTKVGIFGKLAKMDTVLRHKDRVEIYRQLLADPKEARRRRATEKT